MWAGLQTIWDDKLQFLTLLAIYGTGLAAAGTAGTIGAATIASTAKGVGPQIAVKVIIPVMKYYLPFLEIPLLADLMK